MRFNTLFFFLLLGVLYLSLAQGSYEDCCLRYVQSLRRFRAKHLESYRRQELDGGCNIRAIVFLTKKEKQLCADPTDPATQHLIRSLDRHSSKIKH